MQLQGKDFEFEHGGKTFVKKIRIFLGGDYQFLCTTFDHQGANCTNFCLFCKATLRDKKDGPEAKWGEEEQARTLEDLENGRRRAIFPIQPEYVIPLPLHILLGLTKTYLEDFRKLVWILFLQLLCSTAKKFSSHTIYS